MLKITLTLTSLFLIPLITKKYWWVSMITLMLLVTSSMPVLINNQCFLSITSFSGLDMLSSSLMILSILIASLMMLASSKIYTTNTNPTLFLLLNLTLLIILLLCFSSSSLMLFYIWFEASLIPTMYIIMLWGYQPERMQASMYLMMYTITASLPMLSIFCMIYNQSNHALMTLSTEFLFPMSMSSSNLCWMIALGGFLVKLPMFMVHLWLPKAHVEAPIAGSMVLAAILLKLGGYGLARIMLMFPKMNILNSSLLSSIALSGAVFTSLICMRQPDLKSLIAYSSVGHMGLMLAGMLSNTSWGMYGALMMMIAHGLSSSALFILANMSYEITHTRSMFLTKGLMTISPIMSLWWFLFTAANMAAPPSINLLSEIMLMSAIMSYSIFSITLIGLISFLTAVYSLHMFSTTQHGHLSTFTNPIMSMKSKDMLLLLTHITPLILIIMKPEMVSNWM